ncbi:MAG: hypothetical protein IKF07_07680 [Eubacterium sp.]|nr:hypothetical protein [Eubacterium sp.]
MSKTTKVLAIVIAILVAILVIAGVIFFTRASTQRKIKDIESEYTGGLDRHINVYSLDGDKLAEYDGRIDIAERDSGVVKFQLKGKRYIYYNAIVEVIEK